MIDWDAVARKLRTAAERDGEGWSDAQALLHPELVRLARRQPIGRLRGDVDAAHEVAARVLERIGAHDFRALKRLFSTDREPVVEAWIRVLVRTAAIDVMRQHSEYRRASAREEPGWVSLASLVTNPGAPLPSSLVQKQRELERFLATALHQVTAAMQEHGEAATEVLAAAWHVEPLHVRRILTKGERYLPVLQLVLGGHSYPDVARQLGLTRREVELVIEYIEGFVSARGFPA